MMPPVHHNSEERGPEGEAVKEGDSENANLGDGGSEALNPENAHMADLKLGREPADSAQPDPQALLAELDAEGMLQPVLPIL